MTIEELEEYIKMVIVRTEQKDNGQIHPWQYTNESYIIGYLDALRRIKNEMHLKWSIK